MSITNKYTIMCDDIWQENTGKLILIGVYMGNLSVPHVPVTIPSLSFLQVYESDRIGSFTFRMRLELMDTGQALVEGMGMLTIPRPGLGVAPVRFAPLSLPAFGTYNLVVNIEGEQPILFTFDVTAQPQMQMAHPGGFRPPA